MIDIAWALITSTAFATSRTSWAQLRWLRVNVATSIVLLLLLTRASAASIGGDVTAAAIAAVAILRTFADYIFSWRFYVGAASDAMSPEG
jgi:hypothetical protein